MNIVLENLPWMTLNISLAVLGAVFGLLFLVLRQKFLKIIFFLLWVLFIPNTIYMVTDLQYLPNQLARSSLPIQLVLIIQYLFLIFLAVLTYYYGVKPLEMLLKRNIRKKDQATYWTIIIIFNFVIAFGVILGKVQKTHSFHVFTQPLRVIDNILRTLNSPPLLLWVFLFGILFNLIYFGIKRLKPVLRKTFNN